MIRQAVNLLACLCSYSSPPIDPGKETLVPLDTLSHHDSQGRVVVRAHSLAKTYADLACSSGKCKLSDNVIVIHECSGGREVNIGLCVSDILEGCLGTSPGG